jgi:type II restriction/modification system DNA methylase subunit YeeA
MDKSAIKKFAIEARTRLIEQVKQKAFEIGITANETHRYQEIDGHIIVHGKARNGDFKRQREQLISAIETKGFEQVMEEMAYTWFNRFISLRFMEVNGYLPIGVRVLSAEVPARREPDVFREVRSVSEQLQLDIDKVFEMQDRGDDEALFKYIILKQCNALHEVLPFMFEKINDYSELLFPNNLLVEDSVIRQMITTIPEEDWREVEIIGWLYQFYVSEKKDEVFAGLKKNKKIAKENIPAATQLFTPKWIVQYMVENSVGRLWQESHPESKAAESWRYYLEPVEQEPEVQAKLDALRNPNLKPEDITVMDPACGSGHILVYAFDVLYQLYEERGYLSREIPALILKNNLFGLEIDDRAAQLASFALVMKARGKSPDLLNRSIIPNIISIQESEGLKDSFFYTGLDAPTKKVVDNLIKMYADAKNFGSILTPEIENLSLVKDALDDSRQKSNLGKHDDGITRLETLIKQTELLTKKYDVVITNPPYMGGRGMNGPLSQHLKKHYPDSKADLFAVFLERTIGMAKPNGATATINQHSWMFLSSYEKLRTRIIDTQTIQSLLHLGPRAFDEIGGEVVQSVTFVLRNQHLENYKSVFHRLIDGDNSAAKELMFLSGQHRYIQKVDNFTSIPGSPISYWASETVQEVFQHGTPLGEMGQPRQGLATSDNNRFLRFWHEVDLNRIGFRMEDSEEAQMSRNKWFPYNKGGSYRKWYGNQDYLLNWENNGAEIRAFSRSVIRNPNYYFREGITWSFVSSSRFGVRYTPSGFIFDVGGSSLFPKPDRLFYILGFMCSKLGHEFLKYLNPTLNFQVGNIASLPIMIDENQIDTVTGLAQQCIEISKHDWDIFEDSWDFQRHPLLVHKDGSSLEQAFNNWSDFAEEQFQRLKANEEELNRIFIDIYGLEDELTPEVEDDDITIRRADRERDVRSFISYAVGCMFGRYSLDEEGLVYAGGDFDSRRYKSFPVVEDNILTILSDQYFDNDIVSRFVDFVKVTFGSEMLEQNLEYIADSLRRSASDTARETIRKYFLRDFYPDHTRIYKKRPIYWLFSSPKGGFNSLVYMHRYDRDTVARIRTDYLLAFQDKLSAEEMQLRQLLTTELTAREKTAASNRLKEIEKVMNELTRYQELIHNLANRREAIDLDDGVAVNYAKFQDVLAKIR